MKKYLTQPLDFAAIIEGKENHGCTIHQSVAQRIHLILVTNFGEFRSDPEFGCIIWEHDFENMSNVSSWKDQMIKEIRLLIEKYERRLANIGVNMEISQQEFSQGEQVIQRRIKRRIDIKIKANLKRTNELFQFNETLYISPVWLD